MSDIPASSERNPIVVSFPLRGEWSATATPADRVPSHGNHLFGQTYAYDFARLGRSEYDFSRLPIWMYATIGVPTIASYSWEERVYGVASGVVCAAVDSVEDRPWLHPLVDGFRARRLARKLRRREVVAIEQIVGNHIVVNSDEGIYVAYCHLKRGSVRVRVGDTVSEGQHIAEVGTSGNATGPHLHFQIMDHEHFERARGLRCCFESLEARQGDGTWSPVSAFTPELNRRVRFAKRLA